MRKVRSNPLAGEIQPDRFRGSKCWCVQAASTTRPYTELSCLAGGKSKERTIRTARVSSVQELLDALAGADDIEIAGSLSGMPMLTLRPGVSLRGGTLRFGAKGIRLTSGNRLEDVTVVAPDHEVAIGNDTTVRDLGTLSLRNVRTAGQVLLIADGAVTGGHIEVDGLTVASADLRGRADRPHAYGVDALQGALTIWNRQPDPSARLTASLSGISAGTQQTPVRGSGVFLAGYSQPAVEQPGGTLEVTSLTTGAVYTDGGIEPGTPDLISGGVFVVYGARADGVINDGPVTTFGPNDMVLDNWGTVGTWTARAPVTSHGPSGIGFVNFGTLRELDVQAPVTTYGAGARGFNVYDGELDRARFQSITTHADGAVGVQVSKFLPVLEVVDGIATLGGRGTSLVKGKQTELAAIAVSVLPGGRIGSLTVGGSLSTRGDYVTTLDAGGQIDEIEVRGAITAAGTGSDAARISGEIAGLDRVVVTSKHGQAVARM
jgi:hypothetical protein